MFCLSRFVSDRCKHCKISKRCERLYGVVKHIVVQLAHGFFECGAIASIQTVSQQRVDFVYGGVAVEALYQPDYLYYAVVFFLDGNGLKAVLIALVVNACVVFYKIV